jgi:hypothetical protein
MTTDPYEAARLALLDFAEYLDRTDMPAPLPSSVFAGLAREYAEHYRDHSKPLPEKSPGDLRIEALQCAAHWHVGSSLNDYDDDAVVRAAQAFEAYLRGER